MATFDTLYMDTSLEDSAPIPFPIKIEPILPYAMYSREIAEHVREMEGVILKCLPSRALSTGELEEALPILIWDKPDSTPGCLELSILCHATSGDFLENTLESIFKKCVVPEKNTSVLSSHSLYFYWHHSPNKSFLVMKIKGLIESNKDLAKALTNLSSLTLQLSASLQNPLSLKEFFSQRPLLQEFKHAQVYSELTSLVQKLPHVFSSDLFTEMGRLFSLYQKSFFDPRPTRLITKILVFHFLMRENLLHQLTLTPDKRHLEVRYIHANLNFPFGSKPVLGLVLGIAPLGDHEFLEEHHILHALQTLLPQGRIVNGSFHTYQAPQDPVCTLYVELEKKDGSRFLPSEVCILKAELSTELKRRIEKLVPSVFMARNEEETIRNILILSQELKHSSDIPQVMISLDSQTASDLLFTIILVRLLKPGQVPLHKHFEPFRSEATFLSDRVQQVGFLRKNTPKEAHVFQLRIPKTPQILRADYSVNFYLARNQAAAVLGKAIGSFRDYNGGMILKQGELFYQFQDAFPYIAQKKPELLENFFFSLNPIEVQATLPIQTLKFLFSQFLNALDGDLPTKDNYLLKTSEYKKQLCVTIRTRGPNSKEELQKTLLQQKLCSRSLIVNFLRVHDCLYANMIFPSLDEKKQQFMIAILRTTLQNWNAKIQNEQILKISLLELPQSFDPRLAGDELSHIATKMLFEGLTRLNAQGTPELAAAKFVDISSNFKRYTFKLKRTHWSDGSLLSAKDFEYAWKKAVSPDFSTPFAHLFYPIKNAQKAKEGLCSLDLVGITAIDMETLQVDLEHPMEEFLEFTALAIYSPVHHIFDKIHPNWSHNMAQECICNGPFLVADIISNSHYEFARNPFYWDKDHVQLKKIILYRNQMTKALELFTNEEIHWLTTKLPKEKNLIKNENPTTDSAGLWVSWTVFNTEKFPFHNTSLRNAFDLAINKQELLSHLSSDYLMASSPLPLSHAFNQDLKRTLGNTAKALELFELALEELGLTRETFPLITLQSLNTPARTKMANYLTTQWRKLFQIPCRFERLPFNTLFQKLLHGDFQISLLDWKPYIDNPSYTLDVFKYSNLPLNFPRWSNTKYQKLLDAAREELDPIKKVQHLSSAETILIHDTPIFPLCYQRERYSRNPCLRHVCYTANTGIVDFKYAYLETKTT